MLRSVPLAVFVSVAILAYAAPPRPQEGNSSAEKTLQKAAGNNKAQPSCTMHGSFTTTCNPYGSSSKPHAIDKTCGMTGDATSLGDQAQDKQKNNLCANGTAHSVTVDDLKNLQQAVDKSGIDYGSTHSKPPHAGPPADRSSLFTKLSSGSVKESDLVSFVGYIVEAKPGSSETVNCHCSGPLSIDVHMALADHPLNLQKAPDSATKDEKHAITVSNDAALCTNSFVAETIPHLRPASLELTAIEPLVASKIVKVTGPLLFDGSHRPCKGITPGSGDPSRLTVWEIHPVYKIEVCKNNNLDQCKADSGNWQSVEATVPPGKNAQKSDKRKKVNPS